MSGFGFIIISLIVIGTIISLFAKYKTESSGKGEKYNLPLDIKDRVNSKWSSAEDRSEVYEMLNEIGRDRFNVGKDQLIRSILIIADNDKTKIRKIIDEDYYGDPRDVIMEAMGVDGNTNDHGLSPFEDSESLTENKIPGKPYLIKVTPRKLDIYSKYLGDRDSFIQTAKESERNEINDQEWHLIDEFVTDIIMIKNGMTDGKTQTEVYDKIKQNCFDSHTIEKLDSIALKLDSYDDL